MDDNLNARRFTSSAQRVVAHIRERAWDRGMYFGEFTETTAGMLALLSILRWERKVGRAALEQMGVDRDAIAREVDVAIDDEGLTTRQPAEPQWIILPSGQVGITVDTSVPLGGLLDRAEQEALGLIHDWVGTEHILLAVERLACPRLQELLARHGVGYDKLRQAVLDVLQP